jgi:cell division protein FtsQ
MTRLVKRRVWTILFLLILVGFVVATRYYPKIVYVTVSGNQHYSANEVLQLANISVSDPFFWVTRQKIERLETDPWISHATVIRDFPNAIHISIKERKPILSDGVQSYAIDGTVLPSVTADASLIRLEGWGQSRFSEVVELIRLLAEHNLKMISYTPAGFTLKFESTEVFTPSVQHLEKHWASVLSQQGRKLSVYPWGVSAVNE